MNVCQAERKGTGILAERGTFAKVWGVKGQVYSGNRVYGKMGYRISWDEMEKALA